MLKLDLGAGDNVREGFESVDLFAPNAKHKVNLFEFPWPWADNSVDELHASHFIEHIPMAWVNKNKYSLVPSNEKSRDLFCAFFDEAYRILKPDGVFTLVWPALQSSRAFQDPTHRRFIPGETLTYLTAKWRNDNKIGHYLCSCDFIIISCDMTLHTLLTQNGALSTPEANQHAVMMHWNLSQDYMAVLKAKK